MMSMAHGKCIIFSEDPVGLNTKAIYRDQNGVECELDLKKFYELAKKSKNKYFDNWLHWLKNKELTIGAFIITGLNELANEFPKEVNEVLIE